MEVCAMKLADVVCTLQTQGISLAKQAPLWGVTKLQVLYYQQGKTKKANPEVCMNIFNNIKIDGKPVLIDSYNTYEELEQAYNAYKAE